MLSGEAARTEELLNTWGLSSGLLIACQLDQCCPILSVYYYFDFTYKTHDRLIKYDELLQINDPAPSHSNSNVNNVRLPVLVCVFYSV